MPSRTLSSENWVQIQRSSLQNLGIQNPDDLLLEGQPMKAIAMDLVITRYLNPETAGEFDSIDKKNAGSWLATQGIEPTDSLVNQLMIEVKTLGGDDNFRERVLRPLYEQDLVRKRANPEHY